MPSSGPASRVASSENISGSSRSCGRLKDTISSERSAILVASSWTSCSDERPSIVPPRSPPSATESPTSASSASSRPGRSRPSVSSKSKGVAVSFSASSDRSVPSVRADGASVSDCSPCSACSGPDSAAAESAAASDAPFPALSLSSSTRPARVLSQSSRAEDHSSSLKSWTPMPPSRSSLPRPFLSSRFLPFPALSDNSCPHFFLVEIPTQTQVLPQLGKDR